MIRELVYRIFVVILCQHFVKVRESRLLAGPRPPVLQYDRLRHSSSFLRVTAKAHGALKAPERFLVQSRNL